MIIRGKRLRGYGIAPSDGFLEYYALEASMEATLLALRARLGLARARVNAADPSVLAVLSPAWAFIFGAPKDTRTAVLNGLTSMEHLVDRLDGKTSDVLGGDLHPDRWANMAQTYAEGIAGQLEVLGEGDFTTLFGQTFMDLTRDGANFVVAMNALGKQVASGDLPWYVYAGGAMAAVVALAYVANTFRPFLPQRRLAGYTRRRR